MKERLWLWAEWSCLRALQASQIHKNWGRGLSFCGRGGPNSHVESGREAGQTLELPSHVGKVLAGEGGLGTLSFVCVCSGLGEEELGNQ